MFKKVIVFLAAVLFLAGCTNIDSTQKFNAVNLGTADEKAVCQTLVEMDGIYFFGYPVVVGSAKGDGQFTFFRKNLTNENVIYLLTNAVKKHGATRMINVHVNSVSIPVIIPFMTYRQIQGSATGLRGKQGVLKQLNQEVDSF